MDIEAFPDEKGEKCDFTQERKNGDQKLSGAPILESEVTVVNTGTSPYSEYS